MTTLVRAERMLFEKDLAGITLALKEATTYRNRCQRLEMALRAIYEYLENIGQEVDKIDIMRIVVAALKEAEESA